MKNNADFGYDWDGGMGSIFSSGPLTMPNSLKSIFKKFNFQAKDNTPPPPSLATEAIVINEYHDKNQRIPPSDDAYFTRNDFLSYLNTLPKSEVKPSSPESQVQPMTSQAVATPEKKGISLPVIAGAGILAYLALA